MDPRSFFYISFIALLFLSGCNLRNEQDAGTAISESSNIILSETVNIENSNVSNSEEEKEMTEINVKISVGNEELEAVFYDNATTQALMEKFPTTLPMLDLYSREMCYRFEEALPANEATTSGYQVGDIAYWTPRHSFVIFYEQNDEVIDNLQKVGHIDSGVEVFQNIGDVDVSFEVLE